MYKRIAIALMLWMVGMVAWPKAATSADKDVSQANIEKKLESIEAKLKEIADPELAIESEEKESKEEKVMAIVEEAVPGGKGRKQRELEKRLWPLEPYPSNYQPENSPSTITIMEIGFFILCGVVIVQTYAIVCLVKERRDTNNNI